jgi:DNA polymerase III epsilon subunit-like protein
MQDRLQSILAARRMLERRPVFLATTAAGFGADAEVIDVAALNAWGDVLLDTLVKPGRPIDMFTNVIHGITDELVADFPRFDQVWDLQLRELLTGAALRPEQHICIYNAATQTRVLTYSLRQYGRTLTRLKPPVCLMELYAQFYGDWNQSQFSYSWRTLKQAAVESGLGEGGDTALEYAHGTRLLLQHMAGQTITAKEISR